MSPLEGKIMNGEVVIGISNEAAAVAATIQKNDFSFTSFHFTYDNVDDDAFIGCRLASPACLVGRLLE